MLGVLGLTSVTIPNSVTSIGGVAFAKCTDLTSVTIPESVTSIGDGAFAWCTALMAIEVASENKTYSSLEGVLFCDKTLVAYPGGKQGAYTISSSVTSIGYAAFYGCAGLTSLTIGNSVTTIGSSAFSGCEGLTSVTIPASVTTIGKYAFAECEGLRYITSKATTPPTANAECFTMVDRTICHLFVPEGSEEAYRTAEGWKDFYNISIITGITPPSATSAKAIGYYTIDGQTLDQEPASGVYIIRYADGTAKKVFRVK